MDLFELYIQEYGSVSNLSMEFLDPIFRNIDLLLRLWWLKSKTNRCAEANARFRSVPNDAVLLKSVLQFQFLLLLITKITGWQSRATP